MSCLSDDLPRIRLDEDADIAMEPESADTREYCFKTQIIEYK